MAGSFTDSWENTVLDATTGKVAIATGTMYLALFTSDPTDTGTAGTEVSGGSYVRVEITSLMGNASGGATTNTADIVFPAATASWGTVTHLGIYDAATGGTMRVHGSFDNPATVASGDTFKITIGNLTITAD